MILDAVADQPVTPLGLGNAALVHECDVHGGHIVLDRHRLDRGEQLLRPGAEQALTRHGRERHGDLELGVISAARALPRVGPAVVEDIFALAMRFQIGGRRGDYVRGAILDQDRRRRPAGAGADAARILQRREERMADERVVAGQPVPRAGIQSRHAGRDFRDEFSLAVGHHLPK